MGLIGRVGKGCCRARRDMGRFPPTFISCDGEADGDSGDDFSGNNGEELDVISLVDECMDSLRLDTETGGNGDLGGFSLDGCPERLLSCTFRVGLYDLSPSPENLEGTRMGEGEDDIEGGCWEVGEIRGGSGGL